MEKKKKTNNGIFYVVISLVAVLAIGFAVNAYMESQVVNVQGDYIFNEAETTLLETQGENLGAFPGPETYDDTAQNGLWTHVTNLNFADATTTIYAELNPFKATSTIDYLRLFGTDATTTIAYQCATSSTPYVDGMGGGANIVNTGTVATSTGKYIIAECNDPIECDFPSGVTATKWEVGAAEYVVCKVSTQSVTLYDSGVVGPTNTFKGDIKVRWLK
jgi:hypothetical protein